MKQPRALFLLFLVEMWECFSYYGMRVLLVLFMIEKLKFSDAKAIGVYALYTALVELGAIGGGALADRILGFRKAIFLGGGLIVLGHLSLAFETSADLFFLGLGLVITGSCLFKSNIKALLGQFYEENDPRRERGFTLFYTGINVGGFLASILCGYIGQTFGWNFGFGLAALGMFAGLSLLVVFKRLLNDKGNSPSGITTLTQTFYCVGIVGVPIVFALMLQKPAFFAPLLPLVGIGVLGYIAFRLKGASVELKRAVFGLLGFTGLLMLYFAFEELMGSVLVVFCERYVERHFFGVAVPSSVLLATNPLAVIILGALLARWKSKSREGDSSRMLLKSLSFGFFCLGSAFALLLTGALIARATGMAPVSAVISSFAVIALGELFVAPPLFAHCSRIAPKEMQGLLMSIVVTAFSYASLLSGTMGQLFARIQEIHTQSNVHMTEYAMFFALIAVVAIGIGGSLSLRGALKTKKT